MLCAFGSSKEVLLPVDCAKNARTLNTTMRILVVEDELKIASYLYEGLTEQGCSVDVAHDGIDAQHLALEMDYDVIVLDQMLPGLDGLSVLRSLRAVKDTPVIMLTARDRVEDRVKGLQAGADDYLVKPFSFLELLARLQVLTRRSRRQDATQLLLGDLVIALTAKEFSLLTVLARHPGQILSKTAIAELVWGISYDTSANVVEVAIKRLRAKVDAPFHSGLLHTVRGMGYVLEERQGQ